ncbi:TolC family protein [bacterium]|nr:TolC family protein [bacterium]
MMRATGLTLSLFAALVSTPAIAAGLTPDQYLEQVKTQNEEVKGAISSSEASQRRSESASLALAWSLYMNGGYKSDAKLYPLPFVTYGKVDYASYNVGFSKVTSFGLETKVGYSLMHTQYNGLNVPGVTGTVEFFDTTPMFEFKQSVWGNGFGRKTRADQESAQATMLEGRFRSRNQARSLLIKAEETYWQLALVRERVEVSKKALDQAEKIYAWAKRRSENNLADDVDALQAQAALEIRRVDLQTAEDDERTASRMFNRFRNVDSDSVDDALSEVGSDNLLVFNVPAIQPQRDDVKMAEMQQKGAAARAASAAETYKPTLDVYGNYALNGRAAGLGQALGNPFQAGRPTWEVGFRFNMPLDRELASESVAGARQEQMAAEMILQQKLRDQEQDWKELQRKIGELKNRLKMQQTLVSVQKTKLQRERERLKGGRTTTFQVLSFEQDFALSRLGEIGAKSALVQAITQVKQYDGGAL